MLNVKNLTISFPGDGAPYGGIITPVENFNLTLEEGEILGLSGPSGCGKSVFCASLLGMVEYPGYIKHGNIFYKPAGKEPLDLVLLQEKQWRQFRGKEISLVFQDPFQALNHSRTIGAHFVEAAKAQDEKISRREAEELALDLLADVMLKDPHRIMKAYPFEMSGGMCQRVMIAMALLHRPPLLIADEPTTTLDKKNENEILKLFQTIREKYHSGILLVSHDNDLIQRFTDRSISMRKFCSK
ncbi:hypothetical protein AGMMS49928_26510 [Spirochaetia bacterium]|nr:hypothetical protein AGMMS49928_26510 [Spirochaetia bacterium]